MVTGDGPGRVSLLNVPHKPADEFLLRLAKYLRRKASVVHLQFLLH